MSLATIKPKAAPLSASLSRSLLEGPGYAPPLSATLSRTSLEGPSYSPILSAIPKAAAPAPKVTAAPATTPAATEGVNYDSLLSSDQQLQAQLAAIRGQDTANAGQLTALRQRALASYGEIPSDLTGQLTGDVNADIDQTTRDLANEATKGGVSTVAQLQHAYDLTRQGNVNSLAARGMLHSGALGQHTNEDLAGFEQAGYGARQQLLDYLTGVYQNYLGLQSQGDSARADSTNQALQRIIAQINADLLSKQQAAAAAAAPTGPGTGYQQPTAPPPSYGGVTAPSPALGYGDVQPGTVLDPRGDVAPANIADYPWLAANPPDPGYGLDANPVPDEPFTPVYTGSNVSFEPRLSATAGSLAYAPRPAPPPPAPRPVAAPYRSSADAIRRNML